VEALRYRRSYTDRPVAPSSNLEKGRRHDS